MRYCNLATSLKILAQASLWSSHIPHPVCLYFHAIFSQFFFTHSACIFFSAHIWSSNLLSVLCIVFCFAHLFNYFSFVLKLFFLSPFWSIFSVIFVRVFIDHSSQPPVPALKYFDHFLILDSLDMFVTICTNHVYV